MEQWLVYCATVNTAGMVTGLTGGISTIYYIVTTACGTASNTHIITVTSLPNAGHITGTDSVCAGSAITLSDSSVGGSWHSVSGSVASVGTTGVLAGLSAGTDTVLYVVSNVCSIDTAQKAVTVNPLPYAGMISGIDTLCSADTATFISTIAGGLWISSNSALAAMGSAGLLTGLSGGTDTVWYIVGNSCGYDTASFAVTVRPLSDCPNEVEQIKANRTVLSVFPNPNTGSFTIHLSSPVTEDVVVTISNLLGEKVREHTITTNRDNELILNVPAGVYVLAAVLKHENVTVKVVVW